MTPKPGEGSRTSNCSVYAIESFLAALLEEAIILHDMELECRFLRVRTDANAVDGLTGPAEASLDGLPETIQLLILAALQVIV
jgi:hypothetical protein